MKLISTLLCLIASLSILGQQTMEEILQLDLPYWEKVGLIEENSALKAATPEPVMKRYERQRNYCDTRVGTDGTLKELGDSWLYQIKGLQTGTQVSFLDYEQIGPLESQCNGKKNYQGRVGCVEMGTNPAFPDRVFIGSKGGLYRTNDITDAVPDWKCINLDWRGLDVWDMAIDPSEGLNDQVIYIAPSTVGTHLYSLTAAYSFGVLRTINGGEKWEPILDIAPDEFERTWQVDLKPGDPTVLYVISNLKFYWGKKNVQDSWTWNELTLPQAVTTPGEFRGFSINKDNPDEIIAYGIRGLALLSYSSGTWTATDLLASIAVVGVPNTIRFASDYHPQNHSYYILAQNGKLLTYNSIGGFADVTTFSGIYTRDYVMTLKISPEGNIYAGGIHLVRYNITNGSTSSISNDHDDIRSITFPDNTDDIAYIGNDGGIVEWDYHNNYITSKNGNATFYQFSNVGISENTNLICAGGVDIGSWRRLPNGSWWWSIDGDGGTTAVTEDGSMYSMNTYGGLARFKKGAVTKTTQCGTTISPFVPLPGSNDVIYYSGPWDGDPLTPQFGSILRKCTFQNNAFQITDVDWDWGLLYAGDISKADPNYMMFSRFWKAAVPDPNVPDPSGNIKYSLDGGVNWQFISEGTVHSDLGLPAPVNNISILDTWIISDIEFDPNYDKRVWLTLSGFHETVKVLEGNYANYNGTTRWYWTNLSNNLISDYGEFVVNCITYDAQNGYLFLGTDLGLFFMDYNAPSNTWTRDFNVNLGNMQITDLKIKNSERNLYLSTSGAGIWRAPLPCNYSNGINAIQSNQVWSDDRTICGHLHIKENVSLTASNIGMYNNSVIKVFSGATFELANGYIRNAETQEAWRGDIFVEAGGTLIIRQTGGIDFKKYSQIIIKKGGILIIDGGTITSSSNDLWKGITVKGNSSLSQSPSSNQGYVELKNGAVIENAEVAITVESGGIVKAIDDFGNTDGKPSCTFRNNRKSIVFNSYNGGSNYQTNPNVSSFVNCRFINEESFYNATLNDGDLIMVEFSIINGLHFVSCDFICQFNSSVPEQLRGYGIKSTYTTFQLEARCLGNSLPGNSNLCSSADLYPCSFSGLYYGIKADESTLFVNNATFDNNLHGCLLEGEYSYAALPKILLH